MKIVLVGPPGSGKGTLAQGLEKIFEIKHLSMGQLIRQAAINNPTVAEMINKGNLADESFTKKLLSERIKKPDCQKGFILDGYPRSLTQAQNLKIMTDIDFVFHLNVPEKELYKRLGNRLSCPNCNAVYSKLTFNSDVCSKCKHKLIVRADDTEAAIRKRICIYNKNIKPILDFYHDKVVEVTAYQTPEQTLEFVTKILERGEKS